MFFKRKKEEKKILPPMQEIYERLAPGAFHMVDGQLFSKYNQDLIACRISQDENGQFWLYPKTAVVYRAPWTQPQPVEEDLLHEYEARSLQWMASLGKLVYFD